MKSLVRWALRLTAIALAIAVIWPAVSKLRQAEEPMPLPEKTWNLSTAKVKARKITLPATMAPNTVQVPELGITMPFRDTGSTNGWLDLEDGIDKAVHFADGSTLTKGSFLVAAHVNGRDLAPSPFFKLWKIEPGTVVLVGDAAGKVHAFKTTGLNYYDKQGLPDDIFRPSGPSQVVLVTCGGGLETMPNGSRHYTDNVVVRAHPVPASELA